MSGWVREWEKEWVSECLSLVWLQTSHRFQSLVPTIVKLFSIFPIFIHMAVINICSWLRSILTKHSVYFCWYVIICHFDMPHTIFQDFKCNAFVIYLCVYSKCCTFYDKTQSLNLQPNSMESNSGQKPSAHERSHEAILPYLIVSSPNPEQWLMNNTFDFMMTVRWSTDFVEIIRRKMGQLNIHSPIFCTKITLMV